MKYCIPDWVDGASIADYLYLSQKHLLNEANIYFSTTFLHIILVHCQVYFGTTINTWGNDSPIFLPLVLLTVSTSPNGGECYINPDARKPTLLLLLGHFVFCSIWALHKTLPVWTQLSRDAVVSMGLGLFFFQNAIWKPVNPTTQRIFAIFSHSSFPENMVQMVGVLIRPFSKFDFKCLLLYSNGAGFFFCKAFPRMYEPYQARLRKIWLFSIGSKKLSRSCQTGAGYLALRNFKHQHLYLARRWVKSIGVQTTTRSKYPQKIITTSYSF